MKQTAMQQIADIAHHLPYEALLDINKRATDWFAQGGNEDDPYIHQQLRFAKRFVPKGGFHAE